MDDDLERAIAASLADQAHQTGDDRDMKEAIHNSKEITSGDKEKSRVSMTQQEQLTERREKMKNAMSHVDQLAEHRENMKKRKAEDELQPAGSAKHLNTEVSRPSILRDSASSSAYSLPTGKVSSASNLEITYPNGALRITRTRGRQNVKNCIGLEDLIHGKFLVSACVFSFFIAEGEFFKHFPLSDQADAVPLYIGRDPNQDPMLHQAFQVAGLKFGDLQNPKVLKSQLPGVEPALRKLCKAQFGKNYEAFYALSSGSSHSKILALVYPGFLRLIITSCNMMDIDTIGGDNHWYIHDLPKRPTKVNTQFAFETEFLDHLEALNTPSAFICSIRGWYDYSKVKVHLVTSIPGVKSGEKAEKHGLLRLRHVVKGLDLKLSDKSKKELRLEVCMASIGYLRTKWLNAFYDCALGRPKIIVAEDDSPVPDLNLFYPSMDDVRIKADQDAKDAASNIGCHTRPWNEAPKDIRNIFHHYESKDPGRLFHQKLILAYNPTDLKAAPYYVYVGSANFSQSAWGSIEPDSGKKANEATNNTKLTKLSNYECGVVIPGALIEGLMEKGTKDWQAGIVPYVQTGERYDLSKDKAWNDSRWVQDFQD